MSNQRLGSSWRGRSLGIFGVSLACMIGELPAQESTTQKSKSITTNVNTQNTKKGASS